MQFSDPLTRCLLTWVCRAHHHLPQLSLTCHVYVEERQRRALFGGLSDGDVCMWRAKREGASKSGSDMVNVLLKGHRGMHSSAGRESPYIA